MPALPPLAVTGGEAFDGVAGRFSDRLMRPRWSLAAVARSRKKKWLRNLDVFAGPSHAGVPGHLSLGGSSGPSAFPRVTLTYPRVAQTKPSYGNADSGGSSRYLATRSGASTGGSFTLCTTMGEGRGAQAR